MQEIKCPKCGEVFVVDESGYAQIVRQIRDKEFDKEIKRREAELEEKKASDVKIIQLQQQQDYDKRLSDKDLKLSNKDTRIKELESKINESENDKKLAISNITNEKDKEIEKLKGELKDAEIKKELAITKAVQDKQQEIFEKNNEITILTQQLSNKENENKLKEKSLEEKYKNELKSKDELIAQYKDFKARQSTKMIGESLEQHCSNQFNELRMAAFPTAYFEKDNDIRTGSKGDFIFRDFVEDIEFISIMFEMKNEMDETATKHKNEHFLKELDKDRREKKCEYAVLVSMLELDNDYYNNGIVDVSYKYEKMYVIRPQFFIPLITLLRNAALNSLKYRQELEVVKNQQIDILHFEENMNIFKGEFARQYNWATDRFNDAIEGIDKAIERLQDIKTKLLSSEKHLRLANNKAEELSIKKLTKNAPAVKEMFDELKK